jgi:hypothetical protein
MALRDLESLLRQLICLPQARMSPLTFTQPRPSVVRDARGEHTREVLLIHVY